MKSRSALRTALGLAALASWGVSCGMSDLSIGPKDVEVSDPAAAVVEARKLIREYGGEPDDDHTVPMSELPEALKMKGLRLASVHGDHMDFLLGRVPDLTIGARIWSTERKRAHADQPTRYPEIFYYQYDNDLPDGPTNID